MFDQTFDECTTQIPAILEKLPTSATYVINTNVAANIKFNPFESIVGISPISIYETSSIIQEFKILGCVSGSNTKKEFSYLDLDDTEGFSMAIQGRCPKSYCYSVYNTSSRLKWNFDRNNLAAQNFNLDSSCYKTLLARVLLYNTRGIIISFVSISSTESYIKSKLRTGVNCLSVAGTCLIRLDYADIHWTYFEPLEEMFNQIVIYKPAVTSATSTECYMVCLDKIESTYYNSKSLGTGYHKLQDQVHVLETRRILAEYNISKNVDNRLAYDISKAKVKYLSTR